MILRSLTLAGGLAGATVTSQFPEFSQQYMQRLGGAVDALRVVVLDFDASAAAVGLTRSAALDQLQGSDFLARRHADMSRTIQRYETLKDVQAALTGADPVTRALHLQKFTDPQIARATWAAYQPAVPLNVHGLGFAVLGLLAGGLAIGGLMRVLRWPFRRRTLSA